MNQIHSIRPRKVGVTIIVSLVFNTLWYLLFLNVLAIFLFFFSLAHFFPPFSSSVAVFVAFPSLTSFDNRSRLHTHSSPPSALLRSLILFYRQLFGSVWCSVLGSWCDFTPTSSPTSPFSVLSVSNDTPPSHILDLPPFPSLAAVQVCVCVCVYYCIAPSPLLRVLWHSLPQFIHFAMLF